MLGLDSESFKEQCKSAPFHREDYKGDQNCQKYFDVD